MQDNNAKTKIEPQGGIFYPVDGGFLQSAHWEKFQGSLGRKVVRIEEGQASALMILHELPIVGGYFFVPRCSFGEITNYKHQKTNNTKIINSNVETFFKRMADVAKGCKIGWIRFEPQTDKDLEIIKRVMGKDSRISKSRKNHEPAQTLMLDLRKSEEELLAGMKQKTRYNIRLAQKKGVAVFESRKERDIENFLQLTKETAERDGIVSHPEGYYRKMFEAIPEEFLKLYIGKFNGKSISAAMVGFFGPVATYLHGASSDEHRNVMAPFALQWQAIKDAKKTGMSKYDLGGTKLIPNSKFQIPNSEQSNKLRHERWVPEKGSWQGITKFKQGFCPTCTPVEFPGCWDIVLDKKRYFVYKILQKTKDAFSLVRKTLHRK